MQYYFISLLADGMNSHLNSGRSLNDFQQVNPIQRLDNNYITDMSTNTLRTQHKPSYSRNMSTYQQEQFLRTASARLPKKMDDENSLQPDGERKREESMKRLLEWKQKMLQSPLTRKGVSIAMNATLPSSSYINTQNNNTPIYQGIQRSRSETRANCGYNSYSSDDEGMFTISFKNLSY